MSGKISELTNMNGAASIDRAADLLEVVDLSGLISYKATPNFILGFTGGNPVSTTDTQTLTNKTLTSPTINTPTLIVNDDSFSIRDNADITKIAQFQLSGITTGTTRTYILPNASSTLADIATAQTLTNKTLTSPTITNPTLTVDTISEFTSANGVSIDGLLIKDGLLPAGNIQPLNLQSGTGSSWAMQSWVPTWANFTVGNGVLTYAKYVQTGKMVSFRIKYVLGTTSAVGANPTLTLPVTAAVGDTIPIGQLVCYDSSANAYYGGMLWPTSTTIALLVVRNTNSESGLSSTVPFTWATSDQLLITGSYEAA